MQLHYCNAYAAADLATFHCTRVRKMAVSALDPSMLLGFVVRDADDWRDLRRRVGEVRSCFTFAFLLADVVVFGSFRERYSPSQTSRRHGLQT